MLSPVWHLLFLLSVIKYCVAILDLGIQDSELLPSPNIEPNNLVLALESPDGTDTRESSEPPLIQSNDQCRYNANQESRKIRSKRGEFCSSLRQPVRDNGRNGREEPPYLPQIVPQAGKTPASEKSDQPNPDDNLCPPTARYPVCADPVVFPIAPDALFRQHELDISRMQLKYCRACTFFIKLSSPLYLRRRQILVGW